MRFAKWNVRSLYRAGLLMRTKYKLDLVGVQEVRGDRGGTEPTWGTYFFLLE
jgi:hypothetical protein